MPMQGASSYLNGRPDLVWALERAGHQPAEDEKPRDLETPIDDGEYGWVVYCYNCGKRYRGRVVHLFVGLSPRRRCKFGS
jgi:hypothetical protein